MAGIRYGGRSKGTPNKTTAMSKLVIASLLTDYNNSGLMTKDFMSLEPRDRLNVAEKLFQYIMPKMQSTAVDVLSAESKKTIEDELGEMSKAK